MLIVEDKDLKINGLYTRRVVEPKDLKINGLYTRRIDTKSLVKNKVARFLNDKDTKGWFLVLELTEDWLIVLQERGRKLFVEGHPLRPIFTYYSSASIPRDKYYKEADLKRSIIILNRFKCNLGATDLGLELSEHNDAPYLSIVLLPLLEEKITTMLKEN